MNVDDGVGDDDDDDDAAAVNGSSVVGGWWTSSSSSGSNIARLGAVPLTHHTQTGATEEFVLI